jgi:hypothetical protein
LQNIKKMIQWEQEAIRKDRDKIDEYNKLSEEFVRAFEEKKDNKMRLIEHVNQQRNRKDLIEQKVEQGNIVS